MKDLFTIGEVARLFGLNIRTLRYYDEAGILTPEYVDGQTNYRYYSTRQFERLNTIKYLRALDISIQQITEFFRHREVDTMLAMLAEQQQAVQQKKRELELIEKKLSNRLLQIDDALHSRCGDVIVKTFPVRNLVMLKKEIAVSDDLEYPIRDLERIHNLNAAIFLGKVGVSISREHLCSRSYGNFASIFLILEEGDSCEGPKKTVPAGTCATVRYQGIHAEAPKYYDLLLDFMAASGYCITGDSMEITMIDSGMTSDSSKFITELQIPFQ